MYKLKTLIPVIVLIGVSIFLHFFYHENAFAFIYFIPALVGGFVTAQNSEEPIEPGKFWPSVVGGVLTLIIVAAVGASKLYL